MKSMYVLYNSLVGIEASLPSKEYRDLYLKQRKENHYTSIRKISRDVVTKNQWNQLLEKEIINIGGYLLSQSEYEMLDDSKSQYLTDLKYKTDEFLKLLGFMQLTDTERTVIDAYLTIIRSKLEISMADHDYDFEEIPEVINEIEILLDTFTDIAR